MMLAHLIIATASSSSFPPPPPMLCDSTCLNSYGTGSQQFINNRHCQDGHAGADGAQCNLGTDCDDCGPREYLPPLPRPPSSPPPPPPPLPPPPPSPPRPASPPPSPPPMLCSDACLAHSFGPGGPYAKNSFCQDGGEDSTGRVPGPGRVEAWWHRRGNVRLALAAASIAEPAVALAAAAVAQPSVAEPAASVASTFHVDRPYDLLRLLRCDLRCSLSPSAPEGRSGTTGLHVRLWYGLHGLRVRPQPHSLTPAPPQPQPQP